MRGFYLSLVSLFHINLVVGVNISPLVDVVVDSVTDIPSLTVSYATISEEFYSANAVEISVTDSTTTTQNASSESSSTNAITTEQSTEISDTTYFDPSSESTTSTSVNGTTIASDSSSSSETDISSTTDSSNEAAAQPSFENLLGFVSNTTIIGIPSISLTSSDLTASKCVTICGLLFHRIAVVSDFQCVCTSRLFNYTLDKCSESSKDVVLQRCSGDPNGTEICGCSYDDRDLKAVYIIKIATYNVTVVNVDSSPSVVAVNILGSENKETGVILLRLDNFNGQTILYTFKARLVNEVDQIRLSLLTSSTKVDFSSIEIEVVESNSTYRNNWNCKGSLKTTGNNVTNALECNANASRRVSNGDIYYCPFTKLSPIMLTYCTDSNQDYCNEFTISPPFLRVFAYDYCHDFKLNKVQVERRSDCDPLSLPAGIVEISRSQQTNEPATIVYVHCEWGYFNESDQFTSRTYNTTCNNDGYWTPIPPCYPVCFSEPPTSDSKVTNNYNSKYLYLSNISSVSYCCTTGMFSSLEYNQIKVDCIGDGTWSMQNIPNCTNVIGAVSQYFVVSSDSTDFTCSVGKYNMLVSS